MKIIKYITVPIVFILFLYSYTIIKPDNNSTWTEYLGGPERNHYSSLSQINTQNVKNLKLAWEYKSGDSGQIQCNPIVINNILFGVTASNQVFALNAATGEEKWKYVQPGEKTSNVNRGVTYWEKGSDRRIIYGYSSYLCALNAETGQPITSFGNNGKVSLKSGLEKNTSSKYVVSTTPGTIYGDIIVMPIRVGEDEGAAIGYIQAFNVITGKIVWVFKTIPDVGKTGASTWPSNVKVNGSVGAANSWAGMSIDRKRGIIYVPTGSAASDFYGGNRPGKNLFANSLIALNAKTGERIWHYQFVHHDIWDRDLPAPPNLLTVKRNGISIDAVAQVTKNGYIFLFDRVTGKPLFPIEEKAFPESDLPGEKTWPTQPVPKLPLPFSRQTITENDISEFAENREELVQIFRKSRKGAYQPLGLTPTILFPGADGGAEWGGAAVDPDGVLYVNANEMPWLFSLSRIPDKNQSGLSEGQLLYGKMCVSCHKADLKGNPDSGYPSLVDVRKRVGRSEISRLIAGGRGMMPGFSNLTLLQKQAIIDFLFQEEKIEAPSASKAVQSAYKAPYKFDGYNKFLDINGYPAIKPPWGTLTAIDMNTGKHIWQKTLGEIKELTDKGIAQTGTENYGGPVATAGGLLFIGATKDGMFRAFDKKSGEQLWQAKLPAGGFATPCTYEVEGKQYIVIACGGDKLGTKKGDSYVAFALK